MFAPLNEQMDIILSGAAEVLPQDELARKIERSIKTKKQLQRNKILKSMIHQAVTLTTVRMNDR